MVESTHIYEILCGIGKPQKMFTPTGQQKVLKTILEEGDVNAKNE